MKSLYDLKSEAYEREINKLNLLSEEEYVLELARRERLRTAYQKLKGAS